MTGANSHLERAIKEHGWRGEILSSPRSFRGAKARSSLGPKLLALCVVMLAGQASLRAQSDDFNDGNDAGWTRFNPLVIVGAAATFSFPDDGSGGKAYRFLSPAPPVSDAGPARAFGYWKNPYSDFFAAVDVIGWNNELNQAFGFLFRADNIGLGTTSGYVMNYDPQQASGGRGQLQINRVAGERDTGTIGAANLSLEPGRHYRFVLTAKGTEFLARVYDLVDLTMPIASFPASDPDSARGAVGLFNFYRGSAATDKDAGRADTTFDNYFVSATAPEGIPPLGTLHPVPGMPQVVDRSPASRAAFYQASKGIQFTAATFTTNRIDRAGMRLLLNGADVSSGLVITGSETNLSVSFGSLAANTVYDARIVLADVAGRRSTNEWAFDTFTEEFLGSSGVKIIEAEDYNYDGGKFQEAPPVSGINAAGAPVNGAGAGYFDLVGIPEVDYFDHSNRAGSGVVGEYRSIDFVGTQSGSFEAGAAGAGNPPQNDTRRRKYADRDLPEYQVRRTEGGEWLNYTRTFVEGDYNVYLRVAGRAAQEVELARVTSDRTLANQTTAKLGSFRVPNLGLTTNYRFVPLTDGSGARAKVKLSGTETLRLTLGGPKQNSTQYTMALNYLLFVPAAAAAPGVQLESATSVTGPFEIETGAEVQGGATVAAPLGGQARFYRLRTTGAVSPQAFRITEVQVRDGKVIMRFDSRPQ